MTGIVERTPPPNRASGHSLRLAPRYALPDSMCKDGTARDAARSHFAWLRTGSTSCGRPASPRQDYYRGKVLILVDEQTQSRAEFTVMALRTAPDATVVGSQTSGADGNVTQIDLPGGIRTFYSGLGSFYPDGTPTQRIGIVPDVVVIPTIIGIQNGVDEVLQRAVALVQ